MSSKGDDMAGDSGMRFVAMGDSFTEGVGDERPDGSVRGWADLVAQGLADGTGQPVQYANLAIRGRLLGPILTEQVDPALALEPTIVTLNGGGNDMMRPGGDMAHLIELTRDAVDRIVASGTRLVLLAGPNPSERLPLGKMISRRGALLTEKIGEIAAERGITFVDMFSDVEVRKAGYWTVDRIHLNAYGHARVAAHVLEALGHPTPSDLLADDTGRRSLAAEAAFYRQHVTPWVQRRLRGQSSGDGRTAKYADYITVDPS